MSIPESKKAVYILELCRAILQLKHSDSCNSLRELYGIVVDFEEVMSKTAFGCSTIKRKNK